MSVRLLMPVILVLGGFSLGCATHADVLMPVRTAYHSGRLDEAKQKIDQALPKNSRDADVLRLDQATILLTEGQPEAAEKLLREVRDRFDHLEQKSLAEGALALLTDDQRLAYSGEDYEKVLIRAFLALANLLGNGEDAGAYALQVSAKQQQIIDASRSGDDNPKKNYKQVPFGDYLHAALREQTHQNYDDAARSLERVCHWAPEFQAGRRDLERVREGKHSAKGNGVVYVFTLVGRGPYKDEEWAIPTTAALLVADRILSAAGKRSLPPTVAPIKVPRVVVPPSDVQSVKVTVEGRDLGQTETLTDVGRLALEQAEAERPLVIGRAVARRAAKKAVVFGVKEVLQTQKNDVVNLLLDVTGVIWEGLESADTRCWGVLPAQIQVLRLELPAGTHTLALQPVGVSGVPLGPIESARIAVEDGRNAYVLASFPTSRIAGRVVATRH